MNDIRVSKYEAAIDEAKRFIKRANLAIVECKAPDRYTTRANASAKRQSMELSIALVKVRESDYK